MSRGVIIATYLDGIAAFQLPIRPGWANLAADVESLRLSLQEPAQ